MLLKKGTHRYIIGIGPFILKVPRVKILRFLTPELKAWIKYGRTPHFDSWLLREGFVENLDEATCYIRTHHRLLAPLYLPLIFLNIYKREEGVGKVRFEKPLGPEFVSAGASACDRDERLRAMAPCAHTFAGPENFAYNGSGIRILDYGERAVQNLLEKYGDEVERLLLSKTETGRTT